MTDNLSRNISAWDIRFPNLVGQVSDNVLLYYPIALSLAIGRGLSLKKTTFNQVGNT
jgi:hypothetical protein